MTVCVRLMVVLVVVGIVPLMRTAAQPGGGAPFSFIAIGDAGEAGKELTGNARHMLETAQAYQHDGRPLGLLLFLGDNFYPNGLNHREKERAELIRTIIGPHRELMAMLGRDNVHAVPGNHEYYCAAVNSIPYGTCDKGNEYESAIDSWIYHPHYPALIRRATSVGSRDSVDIILFDSALLLTQKPASWRPVLDSLESMLRASATATGVKWRIIAAHHSPYSVGEHGGYRLWLSREKLVGYVGNCFQDKQDPLRAAQNLVSEQDNCTDQYHAYDDSLMALIARSGAKVQAMLAGHDHSLQLLNYPDQNCPGCPKVFVITGAGSKRARVKAPNPPREFTHPLNDSKEKGKSAAGFIVCTFNGPTLGITFIDSATGQPLMMGDRTSFTIDQSGTLLEGR